MRRKKKFDYDKRKSDDTPPEKNWVGTVIWMFFLLMMALAVGAMWIEIFTES